MTGEDSSDEEEGQPAARSRRREGSGSETSTDDLSSRSSSSFEPSSSSSRRLNRLACLTQSDAALTAGLILGSVDSRALLSENSDEIASLLQERGRDAARRVVLNTPHPLTVLSDPRAYGNQGSISRHHNPFNYLRALGKTRRVWEGVLSRGRTTSRRRSRAFRRGNVRVRVGAAVKRARRRGRRVVSSEGVRMYESGEVV